MTKQSKFQEKYEEQVRKHKLGELKGYEITQNVEIIKYSSLEREPASNRILYSNFEVDVENKIDSEFDYFKKRNQGFMWQVYDSDTPSDLRQHLMRRGMKEENSEYLLGIELSQFSEKSASEVVQIETVSDLQMLNDLFSSVWDPTHNWVRTVVRKAIESQSPNFKVFAYIRDGKALSAGWMRFHEGTEFASLWGGMTLPDFRGQGLYSELAKSRCLFAREKGFKYMAVGAWETSRPALIKIGFTEYTRISNFVLHQES